MEVYSGGLNTALGALASATHVGGHLRHVITRPHILVLAVALSWGCGTSGLPLAPRVPALEGVTVSFDSFGQALNLWDQHLAEVGDPANAQAAGSDYWYRLRNDSGQPISFRTASMYIDPNIKNWKVLPGGKRVSTLSEGRRILVLFALEDRKGKPLPYGGDLSALSSLESGRSVLFSIPRAAFDHGQRVAIDFRVLSPDTWEEVGSTYRVVVVPPSHA
jgi:hypothetical protein